MSQRATLKFKTGSLAGKSFSLGPGEYFFIGSAENCSVRIFDDPHVELSHAAVYYDPAGKVLLKDLGSKSGTYINGKRVLKLAVIKPGQRVTIGKFSTFQSSWWNALQATRLTRFSGINLHSKDPKDAKINRSWVFGAMSLVTVLGLMGVWKTMKSLEKRDQIVILDGDDDSNFVTTTKSSSMRNEDSGIFSGVFSAKIFNGKSKKNSRKGIEITPKRQFIWDEIVAISRRFGDPPPSAMDPGFILEVERHIEKFTKNRQHLILLSRKSAYDDMIEKVLRSKGLPAELGYIVWVESNYKPDAASPVGAAGLWQFMPETGAEYGLAIGGPNDERLNPYKSTVAAADYFTSLLRMFGTERYLLAIASYNTGQNRVKRRQIAATVHKEHTSDFWQIRFALPKETAEYVPKVIAAIIIGRNPHRYAQSTAH